MNRPYILKREQFVSPRKVFGLNEQQISAAFSMLLIWTIMIKIASQPYMLTQCWVKVGFEVFRVYLRGFTGLRNVQGMVHAAAPIPAWWWASAVNGGPTSTQYCVLGGNHWTVHSVLTLHNTWLHNIGCYFYMTLQQRHYNLYRMLHFLLSSPPPTGLEDLQSVNT